MRNAAPFWLSGLFSRFLLSVSLLCLATTEVYSQVVSTAKAVEDTTDLPANDDGLPGAGPIRRYDWFKNLWNDKRKGWQQRVAQDQGSVVFLGDSITQGWGDDLGGEFPGMKVANRGISGDTSRGMLVRLEEDVLALNPVGVVLLLGTNDLEEKATPEVIAGNMALLLDRIAAFRSPKQKAAGSDQPIPVIVCQVFPSSASKSRSAEQIKSVNSLYAKLCKGRTNVTVVDTWTLFANESGDAKAEEFPDLLHPNELGYSKWASALRPVLATNNLLIEPKDDFVIEEGFESLFNGKDLTGWGTRIQKTLEKQEVFDGKTASTDGRYVVNQSRIVVTTPTEGSRVQQIWTTKEFGTDFVLRLEFRATPNADSGVFIRAPQLQCRDYPLAGPYKQLKDYRPQQWNELEIVVTGGKARCTCNGEVLEEAYELPASGPIGLEGDRGQMEYRRIRIQQK